MEAGRMTDTSLVGSPLGRAVAVYVYEAREHLERNRGVTIRPESYIRVDKIGNLRVKVVLNTAVLVVSFEDKSEY
jgi:hypothetical protein